MTQSQPQSQGADPWGEARTAPGESPRTARLQEPFPQRGCEGLGLGWGMSSGSCKHSRAEQGHRAAAANGKCSFVPALRSLGTEGQNCCRGERSRSGTEGGPPGSFPRWQPHVGSGWGTGWVPPPLHGHSPVGALAQPHSSAWAQPHVALSSSPCRGRLSVGQ